MQLYYLNPKHALERREWMEWQAKSLGISMSRIEGVDLNDITIDDIGQLNTVDTEQRDSRAVIACAQGHKKIWETIIQSNDQFACIFEDDVVLSENIADILSGSDWCPKDADIVKIDTTFEIQFAAGTPPAIMSINQSKERSYVVRELLGDPYSCAGYIISRNACERLIHDDELNKNPVDYIFQEEYRFARALKIYQLDPAISIQQDILGVQSQYAKWANELPLLGKSLINSDISEKGHKKFNFKKVHRELVRIPMRLARQISKLTIFVARLQGKAWIIEFDCDSDNPWFADKNSDSTQ